MSTSKTVTPRAMVSLRLPRRMADLITFAQAIAKAMTGNPSFPTPIPTLAALLAAIDDLQIAETAALSRVKGAVAVRNDKRATLVRLLQQLKAYVQAVADANVDNGGAIIQSATLTLKKTTARKPRVFEAVQGPMSGSAKLFAASAGARASYEWESSVDGGKTWVAASGTLQAKTIITGLPAASTVMFRYKAIVKTGAGDWSQPIALVVK